MMRVALLAPVFAREHGAARSIVGTDPSGLPGHCLLKALHVQRQFEKIPKLISVNYLPFVQSRDVPKRGHRPGLLRRSHAILRVLTLIIAMGLEQDRPPFDLYGNAQ
jgi:hypothetical protein